MSKVNGQKAPKGGNKPALSAKAITDPRFRNIATDPRFRLPSKKTTHVKLDKRFAHMLHDDEFLKKASVDRYGRTLPKDQGKKELERFYEVDDEEEEDDVQEGEEDDIENEHSDVGVDMDGDVDVDVRREMARVERNYDPAREGGFSESSSEEEDSEDEEVEEITAETADAFGGQEETEIPMGDVSSRIAVVNMDWDNIRAADIMAVASSFCPTTGRILKVAIYTSEYGRERMEREELEGPAPEIFASSSKRHGTTESNRPVQADAEDESSSDVDSDDSASSAASEDIKASLLAQSTAAKPETDSRALRAYQVSRLRYYYAVIFCDSDNTASSLYSEMDGREYLSSANFFDLRFVPHNVTFDDPVTDKPRDECDRVPDSYRPKEFVTEALRHSKVKLTWDMDDPGRAEVQKRAFSRQEVDENDLMAYVGSDSGDDDEDEDSMGGGVSLDVAQADSSKTSVKESKAEAARQKLRAALGLSDKPVRSSKHTHAEKDEPTGGMQVTFTAGISSEPTASGSIFQNNPEDVRTETTKEKYIRKERERKERRKANAKARREGRPVEDEDGDDSDTLVSKPTASEKQLPSRSKTKIGKVTLNDNENDDPFNDPFFADPAAANAAVKKASKAAKRAAEAVEAEATAARKQREREELELLMAGDDGAGAAAAGAKGFDMAEIRKAEKEAAKKGKKAKGKKNGIGGKRDGVTRDGADDFEIDTRDQRFKGLFESHEFAIDPSNPRFMGTKGMKTLLDAGRKRRAVEGEPEEHRGNGSKRKVNGQDGELDDLVNKIKRKRAV